MKLIQLEKTNKEVLFLTRDELHELKNVTIEILEEVKYNPRPVVYVNNLKIYTFKVFHTETLSLRSSWCQLIVDKNTTTIILDNYEHFLYDLNMIFDEENFLFNFMKVFLDDLYSNFYLLEDQLIDLEESISIEKNSDINLDILSSIKHDCMMAEKETRRLTFIIQDLIDTEIDSNRLMNSVLNNHDTAKHLVKYIQHLIFLYNSIINERTNRTINKLTVITLFGAPVTILSGIYGMNFIHMPGIKHEYGYYIILSIMLLSALFIYAYLKRKNIL